MKHLNAHYAILQILLCLCVNSNLNKAYGQNDHFLYVVPNEEESLPKENDIYTNSDILNAVFKHFQVTTYKLAFPRAKHSDLAVTYKVHSIGDVYELKRELEQTGMFRTIELQGYWVLTSCSNPVPINDPFTVYGYNQTPWQLEMIEAGCAWEITEGDANVIIGIPDSEFRTTHEDFAGKFVSVWNPTSFNPDPHCNHGSSVSSMAAANANNYIGVAGIGNKCRLAGYVVPSFKVTDSTPCQSFDLGEAVWQAYLDGRKIINVSWSGVGMLSPTILTAIKQIVSNGTTLVVAAGNKITDTHHSGYANVPGVINVSNVNIENKLGPTNCARNQWVDICAPGHSVFTVSSDGDNQYTESWGTSFSAPGVAGTVGLMLSINPCLSPPQIEAIIKATADPVADGYLYPGLHGAGRLNAYEAVRAAQLMHNTAGFDLFIQDSETDFGYEPSTAISGYWSSESIWLRNDDDGIETHQNLVFDASDPTAYVYVRVRNIGCQPSSGTNTLKLYWAKSSASLYWPSPWDGSTPPTPAMGGSIGQATIPVIPGGGEAIVKVTWNNVPDPSGFYPPGTILPNNFPFSLLARIESTGDPMYHEQTGNFSFILGENVIRNNNIALKNITIFDPDVGGPVVGFGLVGIGNAYGAAPGNFEVELQIPATEAGRTIVEDAEVKLVLDSISWSKWLAGGRMAEGLRVYDERARELLVTGANARLQNLTYNPGEHSDVALKVNFLTERYSDKKEYQYDLVWKKSGVPQPIGGHRFEILRSGRQESELFFADVPASGITSFPQGNAYVVQANEINEPAQYRWLTADTLTILDSGAVVFWDSTQMQQAGLLEVTSEVDGYKDYYAFTPNAAATSQASPHYITAIAPNPASNQATVNYHIASASSVQSAKLRLTAVNNPQSEQHFTINPTSGNYQIQLGALPAGVYIVSLYCDNQLSDSKTLTVH